MRMMTAAFALLLLAGTAQTALAQEQDQGGRAHEHDGAERPAHPRGEAHDRAVQGGQPGRRQAQPQPGPGVAAPQARPAPAVPAPQGPAPQGPRAERFQGGGRWQGDGRGQGGPPGQVAGRPAADGRAVQGRPDRWVGRNGGDPGAVQPPNVVQSPGDRADHEGRRELGETRRFNGGPAGRWEGDHRSADGPQAQGRDGRRDGDRWAGGQGGNWNRGDWRGRPQWRPGAYPHRYHSAQRYRVGPYIRPPHYYTHLWTFGEILPVAWYSPDYLIEDWWNYDLPAPPPGYDWVRVGDDALLIDEYSGRIVQVIQQLFW